MPVMDGLTLLGKLNETGGSLKAVIVSAYGDMPNIRTAMNRGAIDFLMKPIDFQDLEITIHKTLDHVAQLKRSLLTQQQLLAIRQELSIAARIQQSLLPRNFPPFPERTDFDLHAAMVPAKEVGGDLFDFFLLDEDHLGFVIGDVSGKGVPAALFMAVSRTPLRATAMQRLAPGACLEYLNVTLARENPSSMFVTLFYGILNTRTGVIQYSVGGHNPPYIFSKDGSVRQLPIGHSGTIVGLIESARYATETCRLAPGDAIVLYTDGVTEAMNREEDFFSEERLEQYLAGNAGASAKQIVTGVHGAVQEFAAGAPQADDITVLALRYLG
jgi:sigma-B regulation protein RsbU (phosphoserine phosphatase)